MAKAGEEPGEAETANPNGPEVTEPPLPRSWRDLSRPPNGPAPRDLDVAQQIGGEPITVQFQEPPGDPHELPAALSDRFADLQLIGEGGMGTVYRARDRRLDRDVAIKLLHGGPETTARLLHEARSQARLTHESVCAVYEVGIAAGRRFIVMQYIAGCPLGEVAPQMTLDEKVSAIRRVADALHEAHRLGLVHRDVKPRNILVERGDDGAYRPYLMDFGLARDAGSDGSTITGSIVGTPAFMAPEQARGDIRALDRRTDVYGLGATLHASLTGRAPFVGRTTAEILRRVIHEDAPLVRATVPSVPADIEAIVTKCLEKEPQRRYESARALGEDLQRYLDGEPVRARRPGPVYLLSRKAKRHSGKLAIAGAAIAVLAVLVWTWAQSRRAAAEQARLSRELGEDVKEMELFMRNAYGLPLHDVERERDVVRARLAQIERRTLEAGPAGVGPGNYALGRGYLVLRQPEVALGHLRRAESAGYDTPELHYALGLALGDVYRKRLEEVNRIDTAALKEARLREIEARYRDPALRSLRASLGARLESPAYAEGLIAYHEGKHEEALARARDAFAQAPWMYEAKRLEGDVYFAEGSRWRHDAAFDYEKMSAAFERAEAAYREAESIATSDPSVYEAECDLQAQRILSLTGREALLRAAMDLGKAVCAKAVDASPASGSAYIKRAFAATASASRGDELAVPLARERLLVEAIQRAEDAASRNPQEPMAQYLIATSLNDRVTDLADRGFADHESSRRSLEAYDAALRLDPMFLWAWHESCNLGAGIARLEGWRAGDFETVSAKALERCKRALEIEPALFNGHVNRAYVLYHLAVLRLEAGTSPVSAVREILAEVEAMKAISQESYLPHSHQAQACSIEAMYDVESGRDPEAAIDRAAKALTELAQRFGPEAALHTVEGRLGVVRSLVAVRRGDDPGPAIEKARAALAAALAVTPESVVDRATNARLELIGASWALQRGAPDAAIRAAIGAARAALLPLLDRERDAPQIYRWMAETDVVEAEWLLSRKQSAAETLTHGLSMAEKALSINGKMAAALATKGTLLLLTARSSRDADQARAHAKRAEEALSAALRGNPLLERHYGPRRAEAARLAGEAKPQSD